MGTQYDYERSDWCYQYNTQLQIAYKHYLRKQLAREPFMASDIMEFWDFCYDCFDKFYARKKSHGL